MNISQTGGIVTWNDQSHMKHYNVTIEISIEMISYTATSSCGIKKSWKQTNVRKTSIQNGTEKKKGKTK